MTIHKPHTTLPTAVLAAALMATLSAAAAQAEGTSANANANANAKANANAHANASATTSPTVLRGAAALGTAISGTANAAYHKTAQGVDELRKDYHQSMANMNAESARENLQEGEIADAAEDARDAAEHQAEAAAARAEARSNNKAAAQSWTKAKAAVGVSASTAQ